MHYFYDSVKHTLNGQIDEAKRYVVGWAQGGCVTKFKILNLKNLETFYHNLSCNFSKIIYQFPPEKKLHWAVHNGSEGESSENIGIAIKNIDWNEQYYAVVVVRSACGFKMNILPKSAAITEYELYKTSIGLSKILVRLQDGAVVMQQGDKIIEAKNYYNNNIEKQFDQ